MYLSGDSYSPHPSAKPHILLSMREYARDGLRICGGQELKDGKYNDSLWVSRGKQKV